MRTLKLKPLSRQVMVITGASSGIGLTIAREAARRGAKLLLVARNEDALREVCEEIARSGGTAEYVVADVGDREAVEAAADAAIDRFGRIDTWVNDAGVGVYARLEEISDEDHRRVFETNYWGVVHGATAALRRMKRRGGAIITIGSIASDFGTPILSAYAASKHAVKGFIDSLRMEVIHDGYPVAITLIKPSGMDTPFGKHARNYMDVASKVPPPVYHPKTVADAVLYAAENPTRNVTVGGFGKALSAFAQTAPMLADRVFAQAFFKTARDEGRPPRPGHALYEAGDGGEILGDQRLDRRTSAWTAMQTHPRATLALALLAGGAALAFAAAQQRSGGERALAGVDPSI